MKKLSIQCKRFSAVMTSHWHFQENEMQRKLTKICNRRVLNDYLSNLYNKFIAENPSTKLSFSKVARMQPSHFNYVNFFSHQSCLCTKYQNMSLKLKALKDLKIVTITKPDTFVKNLNEADIIQKIVNLACEKISFQVWKNVIVEIKSKSEKYVKN